MSTSLRFPLRAWVRSISNALLLVCEWRSIRIPLARSITARRPNAPSRFWNSANRRSTISIESCSCCGLVSVMYANTPRLAASLTNA